MPFDQGDIVIVPFPWTDQTRLQVRPALVISNNDVNQGEDIILVQITRQPTNLNQKIEISNADVDTPFKPPYNVMYVHCKRIVTIDQGLIQKKICKLTDDKIEEVTDRIVQLLISD